MTTVQTRIDRKQVLFRSEATKMQKEVKATKEVVVNIFIATSTPRDALIPLLNSFSHCLVRIKHFSNLVIRFKQYLSY